MGCSYKVPTNTLPVNMVDEIVEYILSVNENITLRQIKDGIAYGWYYIEDGDLQPTHEVNEYNKHLWGDDE